MLWFNGRIVANVFSIPIAAARILLFRSISPFMYPFPESDYSYLDNDDLALHRRCILTSAFAFFFNIKFERSSLYLVLDLLPKKAKETGSFMFWSSSLLFFLVLLWATEFAKFFSVICVGIVLDEQSSWFSKCSTKVIDSYEWECRCSHAGIQEVL